MSCDTNRHKFLNQLVPQIEEHFSLGEAEAFSLLEASFQRASLPPNLPPQAVAAARLAATADCKALFEEAATQGIALGHRGLPKNFQKVLGYSTLWRIERAIRAQKLPMPLVTAALAREKYGREHCPVCGRFYNPAVGCSHNTTQAQVQGKKGEVQPQTQRPIPAQPSKDAKLPFFVYGTLRTGQGNWQRLLKGKTSAETPATLPGAKMYSRGIAYVFDALASEAPSQVIGNLVWLSSAEDEHAYTGVRTSLDRLEGYSPNLDDGLYRRVAQEVEYTDEAGEQQTVLAWVYQGGDSVRANLTEKERVASGDWLASQRHSLASNSANEASSTTQPNDADNEIETLDDEEDEDDDEYYYANGLDYLLEEDDEEEEEEDIREWELPHELELELEDDSTRLYTKPGDKYAPWDASEDRDIVAENTKPATKAKAKPTKLKSDQKREKEKKERTEPEKVYYFAFDSNMSATRMRQRGVRYTARFTATLPGYRLAFNKKSGTAGKGFANIVPDSKGKVVGVVYETTPAGIAALDRFEGVPVHYYKETVSVHAGMRGSISAIASLLSLICARRD